jgi:hypothetical protein
VREGEGEEGEEGEAVGDGGASSAGGGDVVMQDGHV